MLSSLSLSVRDFLKGRESLIILQIVISERWFPVNERTWAVTIGTLANLFGWGFGFLFPTLIVKDSPVIKFFFSALAKQKCIGTN